MSGAWVFLTLCLALIPLGNAIKNGNDVGEVKIIKRKLAVTGQEIYPFMAHVEIQTKRSGVAATGSCGGVIIGKKAVLTAGHCLYDEVKPEITVHAGIVHLDLEKRMGQKVRVLNYKIHEHYKKECLEENKRTCFIAHDIAIMWLRKEFNFGLTVTKALLHFHVQKPVDRKGWILGWGTNSRNEQPSMLQRGKVKVMRDEDCDQYNQLIRMPPNAVCLSAVTKGTACGEGDSGGPFVIDGTVYGISSFSIFKKCCESETVEIYTFLAGYEKWITDNLQRGPFPARPTVMPVTLISTMNPHKLINPNRRKHPR